MSEHEFEGHREFKGQADPAGQANPDLAHGQGLHESEAASREPGYQEAAEELGSLVARDPDQALRAIGYDPAILSPEDREGMLAGIREALEDEPQEPPFQEPPHQPPPVVPPGVLDEIRAGMQPGGAAQPPVDARLVGEVEELRREFPFLRTEEGERAVREQLHYRAQQLGHPELVANPRFARDTILAMAGADGEDPNLVFRGGGDGGGGEAEAEADHPFVEMWKKGPQRTLRLDEKDRVT